MPKLDPYLLFDGNCAEAMRFYERVLGAKMEMMMTQGEAPAGVCAPGNENLVMHASLLIDGRMLMASDSTPDHPVGKMRACSLALSYPGIAEAKRVFEALSEGGGVTMPMSETFWVESFGMLTDRFGTAWMVSGGKPKV